jgi:hypothetical protein
MTIIVNEPIPVYGSSEWDVDIKIAPNGEPIDFSGYTEIVVTWRVAEFNPVGLLILDSPRDQNAEGIIKIRATHEQTASMKSDGVFDIFGDNQAIFKGYTKWDENVK